MLDAALLFPLLALVLGFKHAYDADHLVAVANFLTRSRGGRDVARMSISWSLGHMTTATIITILFFTLITTVEPLSAFLENFEVAVAIMLITIGLFGILYEVPIVHEHLHKHRGGLVHSHPHVHRFGGLARRFHLHPPLLGVGVIHGLASNDELFLLLVAGLGARSLGLLLGGVGIFTLGVVLGMIAFGLAIGYPTSRLGEKRIRLLVNLVAGSLSILYGAMILVGLGGFNPIGALVGLG